jgi:hypothetical protein
MRSAAMLALTYSVRVFGPECAEGPRRRHHQRKAAFTGRARRGHCRDVLAEELGLRPLAAPC